MNIKYTRRACAMLKKVNGLFYSSPVLVSALALPFVIVPTTSLRAGVVMSAGMFIANLPAIAVAWMIGKWYKRWLSVACAPLVACIFLTAAYPLLARWFSSTLYNIGIYYYLLSVNTLLISRVSKGIGIRPFMTVLVDTLCNCTGFALTVCVVGTIRELLGSSSVFGVKVSLPLTLPGLSITFGGFILLAFLAAAFRVVRALTVRAVAYFIRHEQEHGKQMFDQRV